MSDVGIGHNNQPEPIERQAPPPVMPGAILCTIQQGAALIGRGTRFIYEAIATDKIRAVKSDKRTLVVVESLREYAAGLPAAKIKPQSKKRRAV
jgi:hypothetical protein